MPAAYDVIVIGLGAMGSATLYQLAKRHANVFGIDRYHPPHTFGSTHGESRITRLATGEGAAYVPFARRSHELWREIEQESGATLLTLSGGLILCPQTGGAQFHGQLDFVEQSAAVARAFAIDHAVLDARAIRERWPQLRATDREHGYFEPSGGIVAVEKAVATQLALAKQRGATVHCGETVLDIQHDPRGVTVITDQGRYRADKAIISAGPWIAEFLPRPLAQSLAVYRQVIYWFAADDPQQFDVNHFPFIIWIGDTAAEFYSAFPYEAGGTIGLKMVTEEYHATTTPDVADRVVHQHEIDRMYEEFATRRINGLRREVLKTGVCLYTNTPDDHFMLDFHPETNRILIASPCSGHGFKHSAAIGEALSQLALNGASQLDISLFQAKRLQMAQ